MSLPKKKQTKKYKQRQLALIKYGFLVILFCGILLPSYSKIESTGVNSYEVYLNDKYVGILKSEEDAHNCLIEARREIAASADELVLVDAEIECKGLEQIRGSIDTDKEVTAEMVKILKSGVRETLSRAYTLKIGQYTVNMSSTDDVRTLLQAALDKYQDKRLFIAQIDFDDNREISVLTAKSVSAAEIKEEAVAEAKFNLQKFGSVGIYAFLDDVFNHVESTREKSFDDFEQGITGMNFADPIEIVECYMPENSITELQKAVDDVTQDAATPTVYEIKSGDTLSQISEKVNIPMDTLIAMNDSLEDENSLIQPGQELMITIPQPKLSVDRTEVKYFEEDYEAEIEYIPNDDWYTTEKKTLQEPSAGHHNVMAEVTYHNDKEVGSDYLKEEVTYEAVAKIVERGTKIPPSYIKPIVGGRLTSGFGRRNRPTKGASSYHKGIDWATATGTAVMASSGGVVIKAGWGSGYGNVVYIQHPDGKVTRYGHLSKILVSAGQAVSQGQKIALSGNTGVSTGPHIHFEILVNGVQVNPFDYLN